MSTTHPRANLKIPRIDYAYLARVAAEDGDASPTAYLRKLIARDQRARARSDAEAMLAELYERHPGPPGPSDTEFLRTAVRLYEFMTGEVPAIPAGSGVRPYTATRIVLARIAARALVDGAELEHATGDQEALGAFITALAEDPRVTLDAMRQATGAVGNILTALIDLLGERALAEAAQ